MTLFELEQVQAPPDPIIMARPVGPIVETAWGAYGRATATYSLDRAYRFRLSRVWDAKRERVAFVMLNPSTATAAVVDPTVRRCLRFAQTWGCGGAEVVNLFALRSTDPKALYDHDQPVGKENDEAILAACLAAKLVVAAWGVHGALDGRGQHVRHILARAGVAPRSLRTTKDGMPSHPLYLPGSLKPVLRP